MAPTTKKEGPTLTKPAEHPLPVGTHCSYADYSARVNVRIVSNDPTSQRFQLAIEAWNAKYHRPHGMVDILPEDMDYIVQVDDEDGDPLPVQRDGIGALIPRAERLRNIDRLVA